ncbi:MAG: hypothetical protein D6780_03115, partial [Candidatus Dadabacteria bacterium]
LRLKKKEKAIELLKTYLKKQPKNWRLNFRLGDIYFANKEFAKAKKHYLIAKQSKPKDVSLIKRLASVSLLTNNLKEAISLYLEAAKLDPNDETVVSNLANLYLALKKPDKAVAAAKKALNISPSAQNYTTLGQAYELKKDYNNALIAYERAITLGSKSLKPKALKELKEKVKSLRELAKNKKRV